MAKASIDASGELVQRLFQDPQRLKDVLEVWAVTGATSARISGTEGHGYRPFRRRPIVAVNQLRVRLSVPAPGRDLAVHASVAVVVHRYGSEFYADATDAHVRSFKEAY